MVMLPYADMAVAHKVKERLKKFLQNHGFGRKGFKIDIEEVCFPTSATNTDDLLQMVGNNLLIESSAKLKGKLFTDITLIGLRNLVYS